MVAGAMDGFELNLTIAATSPPRIWGQLIGFAGVTTPRTSLEEQVPVVMAPVPPLQRLLWTKFSLHPGSGGSMTSVSIIPVFSSTACFSANSSITIPQ
jgi:hypothetical protein